MTMPLSFRLVMVFVTACLLSLLSCMQAWAAQTPTDYDQFVLELINRGRLDPAAESIRYDVDLNEGLDPGTITTDAKQALAFNPYLIDAAQGHSQWMLDNDVFSHDGAGGSSPSGRMAAAGYVFSAPYGNGENIGCESAQGVLNQVQSTENVHAALFVDEDYPLRGHRTNLMNPDFREVGVGVKFGVFTSSGEDSNAVMVSEDFAYSAGSNNDWFYLTGAAWTDAVLPDGFYTPGGEGLGGVTVKAVNRKTLDVYTASTWASGGYSLAVPPGVYDVHASGGGLGGGQAYNKVEMAGQNIKLDFTPGQAFSSPRATIFCLETLANGDASPTRADGTDFGSVGLGKPPVRRIFVVRNDGGEALTLGAVFVPEGFTLEEGLESSLAPGSHDAFTVRLNSSAVGTFSGSILFSTDDPQQGDFSFAVTGRVNPMGTGLTLVAPLEDLSVPLDAPAAVVDLLRHFDEVDVDGTAVCMDSVMGRFYVELTGNVTPLTERNFLEYVDAGDYDDSFIHRSSDGVVEGGMAYWPAGSGGYCDIAVRTPIVNEFANWYDGAMGGLEGTGQNPVDPLNIRGTLAMAKEDGDPDSATSRWFINLADNSAALDSANGGCTVFGRVLYDGMDVVDAMGALPTYDLGAPFDALPLRNFSGGYIGREHMVLFNSIAQADELALSVAANTNPALVTPSLSGGLLTLAFVPGASGVAEVAIRAEALDGSTVQDVFQVRVSGIAKGDLNVDWTVDMKDLVLCLQILANLARLPEQAVLAFPDIDVNADGKVGLGEALFVLDQAALIQ